VLVLTVKTDEKIVLPGIDTAITLVQTRSGKCRLGIEAPKTVEVLRANIVPPDQKYGTLLIAKDVAHKLRNKLNSGTTGLALIRRQIEQGVDQQTILRTLERIGKGMSIEDAIAEATGKRPDPIRALLVEDDENERELMAGLLRMSGIEVEAVEDGDDALSYLKGIRREPDVILLDLNMPRMNGIDFTRAVRDQGNKSRIFMVTGSEAPAQVPPVDLWLKKPLNPDRLLKEVLSVA